MPDRTINNTTLHYEESGAGLPPLVLLHGFPLDGRVWNGQRSALSNHFRVIAPDLRGFGKSAPATSPFSMESLADDVHALLEAIGALPCMLGGLSMGGYVALAYVKKYPGDLKGLALIDTRAEGDSPEGKQARQKMIQLVREKGSSAVADQMLPKLLAPDALNNRPALVKELRAICEGCPPRTIEYALMALRDRPDRIPDLPSIAVPTTIIVGDQDSITPVAMAETMNKGIPRSRLVVVKGAGHMACMEQPEQVSRALTGLSG
jgi:pimeloyl-ACP methyl ester carboxylesterase